MHCANCGEPIAPAAITEVEAIVDLDDPVLLKQGFCPCNHFTYVRRLRG